MPRFVTLGESLIGLVANEYGPLAEASTFRAHVVGAELNVAIGVARLGHSAAFIGRVGDDGFGTAILRRLRAEGVDTSGVMVDHGAPTGLLVRERRALGPAEVDYHRHGSAGSHLEPRDVEGAASSIRSADWLHLTGITPAISSSARAAVFRAIELAEEAGDERRPVISIDVNLRRKLWSESEASLVLRSIIPHVDIVFSGLDEAEVVVGPTAVGGADANALGRALIDLGAREAVMKLGAGGALWVSAGAGDIQRDALSLERVIDPVGAGDGFCAGYIAARLEGLDVATALGWAVACGAAVAATDGDVPGLPSRDELERLLGRGPDAVR